MSERIRFGEPIELQIPEEELPPDELLSNGGRSARQSPFQVYVLQDVYNRIWKHLNETPHVESGGVLVGYPFKTVGGKTAFVIVVGAIPQHSDNRSMGHFTVGPEEVRAARAEIEHRYPGLVAVGWYHSHPGHGIFLSAQDMTIVRSIYNLPWQIAMVVDPLQRREGIFVGAQGRPIGGQSEHRITSSWMGLKQTPDCIKAISLYNQARETLDVGLRTLANAHKKLRDLQQSVHGSGQLEHWRDGYRDTKNLLQKLDATLIAKPREDFSPVHYYHEPPAPNRPDSRPFPIWLLASGLLTVVFVLFVAGVIIFWPDAAGQLTLITGGILLAILATIVAGQVVFSRPFASETPLVISPKSRRAAYTREERLLAMLMILLVAVSYGAVGLVAFDTMLHTVEDPFLPIPPSTKTAVPADLPAEQTPLTPFLDTTETPVEMPVLTPQIPPTGETTQPLEITPTATMTDVIQEP